MHIFGIIFFSGLAAFWILTAILSYRGMARIPVLTQVTPFDGPKFPRVSILFAARDEAAKLPEALASLLALDYPNYEVIAVDDRSEDATLEILNNFAQRDTRLKVTHIAELPQGWLGKPHALEMAYRQSAGEWLVFTDADVQFAPDLLRRALALIKQEQSDHLTLLAGLDLRGFWEPTAVGYLGVCFALGVRPWRVSNPKSKVYMGVGAFQMIRRSTYEAIGTHRRLAMEVLDDMKLGKLVKQNGFRSGVAPSEKFLRIRWQEGIGNVIKGMTKNMFAGFDFNIAKTLLGVAGIFVISVLPILGIIFARGPAQIAAGVAAVVAMLFEAQLMTQAKASRWFGMTHALGAVIVCYIIVRSMVVTLGRGGVVWRGTFYALEELKRGQV
ncbi:MAG TPA: glycosyltransferase family 2 protein [Candidatus Acidoferrales bacterium]|nr:glycosyltransferase family 2 protein [Candidatus Acidoferrales bacterium]